MTKKPKVAFVVQRSGAEVNGGAEFLCFIIAQKLLPYWDVEILTTCALDYVTWENYYKEGIETINGVPVRRFKVDSPRNLKKFNDYSLYVNTHMKDVTLAESEKWMQLQGPLSKKLFSYIEKNKDAYDYFFFFTYLYATTYYGMQLVAEKAFLVPAAHDEWPIYLPLWNEWFNKPQALIFSTPEERDFVYKRFANHTVPGELIGVGLDLPAEVGSSARFRKKYGITDPYVLYIGRIDENKGCGELFGFFLQYKARSERPLTLVLAGKKVMEIPSHPDIVELGFIDDQTKFDALDGCEFLINPSPYESLSIVLLEAWFLHKPVLVNGRCEVMVGQCKRSNGGLWYQNFTEFELCVNYLLDNTHIAHAAKQFVEDNYSWEMIIQKYVRLIEND